MSKNWDLVTTLQLDSSKMSASMKSMIWQIQQYANIQTEANDKALQSFRDVSEMGVGEMRKELMQLNKISFLNKTPEEVSAIKNRIGLLRDEMGDLKEEMLIMGGETSTAVVQGFELVAAGVEGVVGTLSVLGVEAQVIKHLESKITSLIAITQALGVVEDYVSSGKAKAIILKIQDTAVTLGNAAAAKAATIAQIALNNAMKASIYGAVAVAVGALVVGIVKLVKESEKAAEATKRQAEENKRLITVADEMRKINDSSAISAQKSFNIQVREAQKLVAVMTDHKRSLEERKSAEAELISKSPAYLSTLSLANAETDKGKQIISEYIKALKSKAEAEALEGKLTELFTAKFKQEQELKNALIGKEVKLIQLRRLEAQKEQLDAVGMGGAAVNLIKEKNQEIEKEEARIQGLTKTNDQYNQSIDETSKKMTDLYSGLAYDSKAGARAPGATNKISNVDPSSMIDFNRSMIKPTPEHWKEIEDSMNESIEGLEIDPIELKLKPIPADSFDGVMKQVEGLSGSLGGFFDKESAAYKAFAISQAIISTYLAAVQVMANQAKLGPIAMGIAFAGTIATGLGAVAKIMSFAEGGIVPGVSYYGDKIPARVNSGEMVLTRSQQAKLFDIANGGTVGVGSGDVTFRIEGTTLVGVLNKHAKRTNSYR